MRCFLSLQSVQLSPRDFACLYGRLAVRGEVVARRHIVVEAEEAFGWSCAEHAVRKEPVSYQVGHRVVGDLLVGGGLEAEGVQDKSAGLVWAVYCVVGGWGVTYDMMRAMVSKWFERGEE